MQATGLRFRFRKWILCNCLLYCIEPEDQYMGLKTAALFDCGSYFVREPCEIRLGELKYYVTALDIGLDVLSADTFQNDDKLFHRQGILPTDIDTSEKGHA